MSCFKAPGAHVPLSSEVASAAGAAQLLEVPDRPDSHLLWLNKGENLFKENRHCRDDNLSQVRINSEVTILHLKVYNLLKFCFELYHSLNKQVNVSK